MVLLDCSSGVRACCALVWLLGVPGLTHAEAQPPVPAVVEELETLKQEVLELDQELFVLEEELLFPANTQLAVFVSLDVGELFELDGIELEIDGKRVSNYLYTERELQALQRGGVHRIWLGNLRTGEHELIAYFTGTGPHARDVRRGATLEFEKRLGAKYVELRIADSERSRQPEFAIREWE